MSEESVRIVNLTPARVTSVHAFGQQPEDMAWQKLEAWARPKGLLNAPDKHRIFGFNNPSPSPGSPNYGYEFWITIGPEIKPEAGVEIKDFPGGLYAVLRWDGLDDPYQGIPNTWKKLVAWRERSRYISGNHQWLEEHIKSELEGVDFILDLYLPISD
jgi:AraC family transcriptional regulator